MICNVCNVYIIMKKGRAIDFILSNNESSAQLKQKKARCFNKSFFFACFKFLRIYPPPDIPVVFSLTTKSFLNSLTSFVSDFFLIFVVLYYIN